jgi:hypothetical protein
MKVLDPARYAWRRGKEGLLFLRGKNILRQYSSHYRRARRVFAGNGHTGTTAPYRASRFGVRVVRAPGDDLIRLPDGYDTLVERVARAADLALAETAECRFFPRIAAGPPAKTADVPEVGAGAVITMQLLDPFALDGLPDLCEPLLEQLERRLYGSYALVDKVYVYRSPISRQEPQASWRWHFDNHPREMLKVMVYLTDVSEGSAPFVYLRERSTGRFMMGSPLTPLFGNSRVPNEQIAHHLANGWDDHPVTGPRGTILIFDDNVVHRGTLAQSSHRDVLVFQIRPSTFKASPRIDRRWTGTFGHKDISADPDELTPRPS